MKRFGILLSIILLVTAFSAYAVEETLIDFATLTADDDSGQQNAATVIDFSDKAGTSFTEEEKQFMKTSLAIENWDVVLASSSRTIENQRFSYTREAPVKDDADAYAGDTVLGARVHFPIEPFNSWAKIQPPFDVPAYMTEDGQYKFASYGVLHNVGVIKSISINVMGKNFPNGLGLIFKDQTNKEISVFVNYLNFDGWKTLTWNNPNYITDVRNRELKRYPLYPKAAPMLKLDSIVIFKDAQQEGGDFITYIKDINVVYDEAVLGGLDSDIDDEAIWGILNEREEARRTNEFERLGNIQVLRYLEQQKMHQDEEAAAE